MGRTPTPMRQLLTRLCSSLVNPPSGLATGELLTTASHIHIEVHVNSQLDYGTCNSGVTCTSPVPMRLQHNGAFEKEMIQCTCSRSEARMVLVYGPYKSSASSVPPALMCLTVSGSNCTRDPYLQQSSESTKRRLCYVQHVCE